MFGRKKPPRPEVVFTLYKDDPKSYFRRAVKSPMTPVRQWDMFVALAAIEEAVYGAAGDPNCVYPDCVGWDDDKPCPCVDPRGTTRR